MRYSGLSLASLLMFTQLSALPVSADELGRLFMTREQRANLNDIRYQSKFAPPPEPEPAPVAKRATPQTQTPVVSSLMINGVVRPSRGAGTVWLNNQQVERGSVTREGIKVTSGPRGSDGVRIKLPSGVDTIVLKPGQKIDVATGSVLEAYEADPNKDAKSAFEPETGQPAVAPTPQSELPQAPAAAAAEAPAKLSREQILKLLRDTAGKSSSTSGQSLSP